MGTQVFALTNSLSACHLSRLARAISDVVQSVLSGMMLFLPSPLSFLLFLEQLYVLGAVQGRNHRNYFFGAPPAGEESRIAEGHPIFTAICRPIIALTAYAGVSLC